MLLLILPCILQEMRARILSLNYMTNVILAAACTLFIDYGDFVSHEKGPMTRILSQSY